MRAGWRTLCFLPLVIASGACALNWALPTGLDAGGGTADGMLDAGGSGPDAGIDSGTDIGMTAETGAIDSTVADTSVAGDADSGAADAGPSPCLSNSQCTGGTFCHFPDHLCGTGASGVCVLPRTLCTASDRFVCTCNGSSQMNECAANAMGLDTSPASNCGPFIGEYFCGYLYCYAVPCDYCVTQTVAGEVVYSCESPPGCSNGCGGCSMPGCNCTDLSSGCSEIDCP